MKKILCSILTCMLVLTGCTAPSPTAEPTTPPAATPTATPAPAATNLVLGGTAEAFRSEDGMGPEKAIDGDITTCWKGRPAGAWAVTLPSEITFNTVTVRYKGPSLVSWSVQYYDDELKKFVDIPGCLRNYETGSHEIKETTFCINPITVTRLQFNIYNGAADFALYEFGAYYNEGQDPCDSRNSYISAQNKLDSAAINLGNSVFDLIPQSKVEAVNTQNWTNSIEKDATLLKFDSTKWRRCGMDEISVFDTQITHVQADDPSLNWNIRVGTGGSIYSFETAIGDIIPPQNVDAEWMDEVWQIVAVSHARMIDTSFTPASHFIHQAGMYKGIDMGNKNYSLHTMLDDTFFAPRLADCYLDNDNTLRMLSMGVTPSANITRSDVLYYTDIADKGDGIIELTYGVANYSANKLDFFNFPWGGVRHSLLPEFVLSNPDGTYTQYYGSHDKTEAYSKLGGWFAHVEDAANPDSFAVGFVVGNDSYDDGTLSDRSKSTGGAVMDYYTGDPERDYHVLQTVIRRNVAKNEVYWYRIYVVIGKLSEVAQKCNDLADKVMYGLLSPETASTVTLNESQINGKTVLSSNLDGTPKASVYASHVKGSLPIYLIYDNDNQRYIATVDPYIICDKLPLADYVDVTVRPFKPHADAVMYNIADGSTSILGIIGYAMQGDFLDSKDGWVKASEVLGETFIGTGYRDGDVYVMMGD